MSPTIRPGDLLVVDRAVAVTQDKIILAIIDGEFTIKRFCRQNNQSFLIADNPVYRPIDVTERDWMAWGVVTYVIHQLS